MVDPQAWPHERVGERRLAARMRVATTAGANPGRGGAGVARRGNMGSALSATPQLLAKLAELPPADDDPEIDVEVEMRRPPSRFTLRRFSGPFRSGLTLGLSSS